ncbi:MAG: sugar phosphate isomerase/epimerase family protein [Burkholderiaceae bacterium]
MVISENIPPVEPDTSPKLSQLALNLITVGTDHHFEQVLDACVAHGIRIVSPWRSHYAEIGVNQAAALLRERSLSVSTVCRMSEFGAADSETAWQSAITEAHQVIGEAATLRAASITVIGGGLPIGGGSLTEARNRIERGLEQVLPSARAAGVNLAIEALHPMVAAERGGINTIAQAVAMAKGLGEGAGVMIDAYNTWWDPALSDSIADAKGWISGYQMSDWLVPTTDMAFDRGMPGEGVIDLPAIRSMVQEAGFQGPYEVEVLSARWSAQPLDTVLEAVTASFLKN